MKKQRLTKALIAQHMKKIARTPDLATLQARAALLDRKIVPGEADTFFYAYELYPDFAALQDALLLDLGNASRSLYKKRDDSSTESTTPTDQKAQDEEELQRLNSQIIRVRATLNAAQEALRAAQAQEQQLQAAAQAALSYNKFVIGQGVIFHSEGRHVEGIIEEVLPTRLWPYHILIPIRPEDTGRLSELNGFYGTAALAEELTPLYGPLPASIVETYHRRRGEEAQV